MEEKQNPNDSAEQEMVEESDDSSRPRGDWSFMIFAVSVVVAIYAIIYGYFWAAGVQMPGFAPN